MVKVNQLSTREVIENGEKIFHKLRYPDGIVWCPYCGCLEVKDYGDYKYRCKHCGNRFSDRTRTILHNSKLSTVTWMQAIYEILNTNFISGYELAKKLKVTQKTAWYLHFRIGMSIDLDSVRLHGVVAMDEVYLGCHMRNMHLKKKLRLLEENNIINKGERYTKDDIYVINSEIKQHVYGLTDGNNVALHVCPNPITREYIYQLHRLHCGKDVITVSDDSALYRRWTKDIGEIHINRHSKHQYVTPDGFSSNPIENTFSWVERGYAARMTHTKHTQIYLNEFCFRYNTRNISTEEQFKLILTPWKIITYKDVMNYNQLSWVKHNPTDEKFKREMEVAKYLLDIGIASEVEVKHRRFRKGDI